MHTSSEVLGDPPTPSVMGIRFDAASETEVVRHVFGELDQGRGGWIVTPNVEIMRRCTSDADLHDLVSSASIRLVDGAPVEWAARLAGRPPGRPAGVSLVWSLSRESARRGRTVLLFGGRPGAAKKAAERLAAENPGLDVQHHFPPFGFERNPEASAAVRHAIAASGADIVLVGLGFPKQERLMRDLHSSFPSIWMLGCGAGIDFAAGIVPRAPRWMQVAGLEWGYRLAIEPKRSGAGT